MTECPEYNNKEIPDDCYGCPLNEGNNCISNKVEIAYLDCPYGENWDETIPEACWDCNYYDGYDCSHPKKT